MEKHVVALASCHRDSMPSFSSVSPAEAVARVLELAAAKSRADSAVLLPAEYDEVCACLGSIGSDELSVADDGSVQGKGHLELTAHGMSASLDVEADIEVKNVWDRTRREWACNVALRKPLSTPDATRVEFVFDFVSFGNADDGTPTVVYNFSYERVLDTTADLLAFNKGDWLRMSEYDISSFVQWGYLISARCLVMLSDGSEIVI